MMKRIDLSAPEAQEVFDRLLARSRGIPLDIQKTVRDIVEDVRINGDTAVLSYTQKFDKVDLQGFAQEVTPQELAMAVSEVPQDVQRIMEKAARNIREFHEKQKHNSWMDIQDGALLGQKITPLEKVAVYAPGGRAAYPSSVLMNIIPAKVAGVKEIVLLTPPMADGRVYANTLAAAAIAGADRVFKVGGAQAVAAAAYGTQTIPRVDKITGPGNIFVAAAKREVYGQVGIDMIAGPSEILILADSSANPRFVAADMLSQAEHDAMAAALLVTCDRTLADKVSKELEKQLAKLDRQEIARRSIEDYGAIIIARSMDQAVAAANALAPEHMELLAEQPMELVGAIRNAGAIFLGSYSPEPLGDYFAGPNHVLPTGGTARFFSPLSVDDFVKKSSVIYYSKQRLEGVYRDIAAFAQSEGLQAHRRAVEVRFEEEQ